MTTPERLADPATVIGDTATVMVDGEAITGTVYYVRTNGWPSVETDAGRIASGPKESPDNA